jgi:hypothetical protein
MSIIPASRLSSSDLAMLGNNTDPAEHRPLPKGERDARRAQLAAVNRSLGRIGEQVSRLHRPLLAMPPSLVPHQFAS